MVEWGKRGVDGSKMAVYSVGAIVRSVILLRNASKGIFFLDSRNSLHVIEPVVCLGVTDALDLGGMILFLGFPDFGRYFHGFLFFKFGVVSVVGPLSFCYKLFYLTVHPWFVIWVGSPFLQGEYIFNLFPNHVVEKVTFFIGALSVQDLLPVLLYYPPTKLPYKGVREPSGVLGSGGPVCGLLSLGFP